MKMLSEPICKGQGRTQGVGTPREMLKTAASLVLHPGAFYAQLPADREYGKAILFLFLCSLINAVLTALYVGERYAAVTAIAFVNAFLSPLVLALLLYSVTKVLCRRTFSFVDVIRIMAYAGVTLLFAWIPGMAWPAGIWRFFLVGLGMVKSGGVSTATAFAALACTALIFLLMVKMLGPLAGTP